MKQIVIMPGGFHPFHAGHYSLYNDAKKKFPNADLYVAATNDMSERPFPFNIKEKLAKLAGVEPGHFIQVKSPFQAKEITQHYNPDEDVLIFVRSEKDRNEQPQPGGTKKDGSPAYFQPWTGKNVQPFSKHAYMDYLPTVEFGPGITSATQIRKAWPTLNDKRKLAMVYSLYPDTQKKPELAQSVVKIFDKVMGAQEVSESQTAKAGIVQTEVYGTKAYHAKCMESNCDWESKRYDRIKQAQAAAKKHSEQHFATKQDVDEDKEIAPVTGVVLDFYKPVISNVQKEKVPDYVDQARELLSKTDDPSMRRKVLDILKKGKENPYLQGGIITTVGALLAGGVLNSAQSMGLSPQQTNLALQGVLNTVIPTLVSRINGKNWKDTIKYTLASAGVGTGIAAITEEEVEEGLGPNYPGTYEEENKPFMHKGQYRIRDITSESIDYLEEV
jgi:hypothetical protein